MTIELYIVMIFFVFANVLAIATLIHSMNKDKMLKEEISKNQELFRDNAQLMLENRVLKSKLSFKNINEQYKGE